MVVVAILGAIAADRAAQGEFAAAINERRLDQGQMLEIQYRQSLLDLGNKGAEFARRRDQLMPASITPSGAPEREVYGPWRALSRLSGHDDVSLISPPYESAGRYFWELHQMRNDDASCFVGGKYRAEFYVNGTKVLVREFPMSFYGFNVTRWHQLGIVFCRPASWRAWQDPSTHPDLDLVQGLQTKNGTPAVFAFTFFSPATLPGKISKEGYFLNRALQYLRNAAVLPVDGALPVAVEQACERGKPVGGFIGKVWTTPEGVHVGLVLGKSLTAEQACNVALSINSL